MKKRILSLLLVMIMLIQALNYAVVSVYGEDGDDSEVSGIDPSEMVVGKLYSAVWNYEYDDVILYKEADDGELMIELPDEVRKSTLPQNLTVKMMLSGDFYLYITNEDWPQEYEEYRYVESYELIVLECLEPVDDYIYGQVDISCDKAIGNTVMLEKGDKAYAITQVDSTISDYASYQWQIKLSDGRWADIADYIYPYAVLSEAILKNVKSLDGKATLRCIVTDGGNQYASTEINLAAVESAPVPSALASRFQKPVPQSLKASFSDHSADVQPLASSIDAFQIIVKYTYKHTSSVQVPDINGTSAANTFTITYPTGSGGYSGVISSPPVAGYLPYVTEQYKGYIAENNPASVTYDGTLYYLAASLKLSQVSVKTEIEVFYIPQEVNFLVKIYEQNLHDDEYVLAGTRIESGLADAAVGEDLDTERTGFSPLYYDPNSPINSDGTSVVEIYYDRNYYLVDFDLDSTDAYGVVPYYVRYGSQVMLPTPIYPGYQFTSWTLDKVYTVENDVENVVTNNDIKIKYDQKDAGKLIEVMHNVNYSANWSVASASYTIVYWLENADSTNSNDKENYDVWYTHSMSANTGTQTIAGADNIKTYVKTQNNFTQAEVSDVNNTYYYLIYQNGLTDTDTKTVAGDGSTTINIYYSRKVYTLKFYYAIEKSDGYYIIGGTSHGFSGSDWQSTPKNPIEGMRRYASGDMTNQAGKVTSKPTLNAKGSARNYTSSFDQDGDYNYHYISFSAKYGADITNLWPCDVFDSVTRSYGNIKSSWTGTEAFVSAWNGENRVKYTQDNWKGNLTVKGNYTQLDEYILWNDKNETDTTVSYTCFWENGADVEWSVPELYRYHIYLPLLDGQSTDGLSTRIYNGVTYYLSTAYDTVDNSTCNEQTQPSLVGFKANGKSDERVNTFDTNLYSEAYNMYYFYSRNTYNLEFNDQYGNAKTVQVPYGTDLSVDEYAEYVPSYPTALEDGEKRFVGWHIDESGQNPYVFENETMPAKNIQLYAKWETISYGVRVYMDPQKTHLLYSDTLSFGSSISEPDYKTVQESDDKYKNLIFAGWYYMDGTEEKRFDFKTMILKRDIDIYAKWTSTVPVPYKIRYVIENDGNLIDIADPTEGVSLANLTKTFVAKVGDELNSEYQVGYFPEFRSHAITMSNENENEYIFVYSQPSSISYTVTHEFISDDLVDVIGNRKLVLTLETQVTGNSIKNQSAVERINFLTGIDKSSVTNAAHDAGYTSVDADDLWDVITQMSPNNFEQELILTTGDVSNITFIWSGRNTVGMYQVVHYFETLEGGYIADYSQSFVANIGDNVEATPIERYGFEHDTSKINEMSGTVKKVSVSDPDSGLILRVYYNREMMNYTVKHYKEGTATSLADDSTTYSIKYGQSVQVADRQKNILGYTLINGGDSVEIVNDNQQVICYYRGLDVFYRYQTTSGGGYFEGGVYNSDTVVGTAPSPSTLKLLNGYVLSDWYYIVDSGDPVSVPSTWITDGGMTIKPGVPEAEWANKTIYVYANVIPTSLTIYNGVAEQPFIYVINGKAGTDTEGISIRVAVIGSETVYGLPVGDYTVTLEGDWSWQYSIAAGSSSTQNVTVDASDPALYFDYAHENQGYITDHGYFSPTGAN